MLFLGLHKGHSPIGFSSRVRRRLRLALLFAGVISVLGSLRFRPERIAGWFSNSESELSSLAFYIRGEANEPGPSDLQSIEITEGGQERTIRTVLGRDAPIRVVFLVDASAQVEAVTSELQRLAHSVLESPIPDVEIVLISLGDIPMLEVAPTRSSHRIDAAVAALRSRRQRIDLQKAIGKTRPYLEASSGRAKVIVVLIAAHSDLARTQSFDSPLSPAAAVYALPIEKSPPEISAEIIRSSDLSYRTRLFFGPRWDSVTTGLHGLIKRLREHIVVSYETSPRTGNPAMPTVRLPDSSGIISLRP